MNPSEENVLFEKIKTGDEKSFEALFHKYYAHLCNFANQIIEDNISAEEIVQDFFVKLWEKKEQITIESSVKNYLFRSVKNLCLNLIQHNNIRTKYSQKILSENNLLATLDNVYFEVNLAEKIEESIKSLPEKRREIFKLSREKGLKYREIAEKLNISVKTVEAQMGLAMKTLREKLKDYKPFFTLFLCLGKKQN